MHPELEKGRSRRLANMIGRKIGFVDPLSLFMFFDPFSVSAKVRDMLLQLMDMTRSEKGADGIRLAQLSQEEQHELYVTYSAIGHEMQHFRDYLYTSHGNKIVRLTYRLYILLLGLFQKAYRNGSVPIRLPVRPEDVPYALELYDAVWANHKVLEMVVKKSRICFEVSALLTQQEFILRGGKVGIQVFKDFFQDKYTGMEFLKLLQYGAMQYIMKGQTLPISDIRLMLLAALSTVDPDAYFVRLFEGFFQGFDFEFADKEQLHNHFQQAVPAIKSMYQENLRSNFEFGVIELKELTDRYGINKGVYEAIVTAFMEFTHYAVQGGDYFKSDPDDFLNFMGSPFNKKLRFPHLYLFSGYENSKAALVDSLPEIREDEIWSFAKVVTTQGHRHVLKLLPFTREEGDEWQAKKIWVEMAKISGSICLFEGADFSNPLNAWWIRTMHSSGFCFEY